MKASALFAAAVALSACSTAPAPVDQSAETTPLTALEAIDIAEAVCRGQSTDSFWRCGLQPWHLRR